MPRTELFDYAAIDPEHFARLAADHDKWRSVAICMMGSAEVLWPLIQDGFRKRFEDPSNIGAEAALRHRGPFYLLAGLAIENMLKALIVQRKLALRETISTDDKMTFVPGKHDYLRLAGDAGLAPTPSERRLLEKLERYVTWAGRYPLPKNRKDLGAKTSGTVDWLIIKGYFDRLVLEYSLRGLAAHT